ncbi:MAG: hypothetical protein AAFS02_10075 [Pseudomonadota bacterium]
MNRNLPAWLLGLALAAAIVALWASRQPAQDTAQAPVSSLEPAPGLLPAGDAAPAEAAVTGTSQRVADLEQALQLAIERRQRAEQQLEASEKDVERLEAFVDDIVARGEDPADYAEEGLKQFQPAFMRYEQAFASLEEAELVEQAARDALAEARAAADPQR